MLPSGAEKNALIVLTYHINKFLHYFVVCFLLMLTAKHFLQCFFSFSLFFVSFCLVVCSLYVTSRSKDQQSLITMFRTTKISNPVIQKSNSSDDSLIAFMYQQICSDTISKQSLYITNYPVIVKQIHSGVTSSMRTSCVLV